MSKKSKMTLFLITSLAIASLVLAFVILSSQNKRLSTYVVRKVNHKPPVNNDEVLSYSEINLHAQRSLCSPTPEKFYLTLPDAVPRGVLPSYVEVDIAPQLTAKLTLLANGDLVYSLNTVNVWTSRNPREHVGCTELNVMNSAISRRRPEDWPYVSQTTNGVRFHVSPLAVTLQYGDSRRIIWTFLSGWDAVALCGGGKADCEIPAELPSKGSAEVVLINGPRNHRLLLLPNADVLIVETSPNEPRGSIRISKLKTSLQVAACR
jgi:hypothetical protein